MYPSGELALFALQKKILRDRIAAERAECAAIAERITRPLARIDRVRDRWQRVSPLLKAALVPLVFTLQRQLFRRVGGLLALRSWIPLVTAIFRNWHQARQ